MLVPRLAIKSENGEVNITSSDDLLALDPELINIKYEEGDITEVIQQFSIEDSCAGNHTFLFDMNSSVACFIKSWEEIFNSVPISVMRIDDDGQQRALTPTEVAEYLPEIARMYAAHVLIFLLKELHPAMEEAFHATYHVALDRAVRHISARMQSPLRAHGTEAEAINAIFQDLGKKIKDHLGITPGGSAKKVVATNEQAKIFAQAYPDILKHWQNIKEWRNKHPETWRRHAKVDCSDTPDDLLDLMERGQSYEREPYRLAHYHAARRAGIQTEINRRGKVKQCSYETLNTIFKRGKQLL